MERRECFPDGLGIGLLKFGSPSDSTIPIVNAKYQWALVQEIFVPVNGKGLIGLVCFLFTDCLIRRVFAMKITKLYVGLNSNHINPSLITGNLNKVLNDNFQGYTIQLAKGVWEGVEEGSIIVTLATDDTSKVNRVAIEICKECGQDCVMLERDGVAEFVGYDPTDKIIVDSILNETDGHSGECGIRKHSCGPIFPYHIVLIGGHQMELWNGSGEVVEHHVYDGVDYTFAQCHRDLEAIALAKIENDELLENIDIRWG